MMQTLTLTTDFKTRISRVQLNRPETHNAFNEVLIKELTDTFLMLMNDNHTEIIILSGSGKSFCAGADLNWMGAMVSYTRAQNVEDAQAMAEMFEVIDVCQKPVLGQVHGAALGGGAGLAAVCDWVAVAPEATFAFSEVKLGLIPSVISPYVVRKIGYSHARALFVSGERFDAETALRIGLTHKIVPADQLEKTVDAMAKSLLKNGRCAMAESKALLRALPEMPHAEARVFTVNKIADIRVGPEAQEGIKAFLEKRRPSYVEAD